MYRMVTTAPYRHRPQIEASKGSAHHPPNRPLRQPRHSTTAPPNAHRPPAATHSPTPTPTHHTTKKPQTPHHPHDQPSNDSAHLPPHRPLRQPRHSTTAPPNAHRPPAATHSPTPTPTHHT